MKNPDANPLNYATDEIEDYADSFFSGKRYNEYQQKQKTKNMSYSYGYQGNGFARAPYAKKQWTTPKPFNYRPTGKPKSGCKKIESYVNPKTGELVEKQSIEAWKVTKRFGFMSLKAYVAKRQARNPKAGFTKMVCEVSTPVSRTLYWGVYNSSKHQLWIPDLKMVANTSKNFWAFIKPKNR